MVLFVLVEAMHRSRAGSGHFSLKGKELFEKNALHFCLLDRISVGVFVNAALINDSQSRLPITSSVHKRLNNERRALPNVHFGL